MAGGRNHRVILIDVVLHVKDFRYGDAPVEERPHLSDTLDEV